MNARSGSQAQMRTMNMGSFGAQPNARQNSRLQNTQKTGLGNGNAGAGWAFGAPASAGTGFGAPGLARPGQLSGFAQIMGGGGQTQIDMNDFPTLAGPGRSNYNANSWNSNAVRQAQPPQSASQQSVQQQRAPSTAPSQVSVDHYESQRSQQQSTDRGGTNRSDFPQQSDQVSTNGDATRQNGLGSSILGSPSDSIPQTNGQQSQLPMREVSGSSQQAPIGSGQPTPQSQVGPPPQGFEAQALQHASHTKRWDDLTETERYGMAGLMSQLEARRAIESNQAMDETLPVWTRNTAFLMGQETPDFGMDLNNPEPLYPTFSVFGTRTPSDSFYDFRDQYTVPSFHVPPAYTVNNVPEMASRMPAFSDETLFCIFYQMPRDIMQEMAATQLNQRDWRWHKVLRKWLQKDTREANAGAAPTLVDHTNGAPIGQEPIRINERSERGVYIFFEEQDWKRERREFTLDYDSLYVTNLMPTAAAAGVYGGGGRSGNFGGMNGGPVGGSVDQSAITTPSLISPMQYFG
ncbi:hypothetical protein CBER1_10566 [Cercospora berteroae]|uniref:NOT2/NOT3/NOT5 C-terminal domain-containing protein n=1 Tax=Cercospora berteroae TaxID=357750 RepID=A0A2S6BYX4_9PEZI|nr:hypothetical protein CBER1_10566 [Cercospora berteroae]